MKTQIKIDIYHIEPGSNVMFFVGEQGYFATLVENTQTTSDTDSFNGLNDKINHVIKHKVITFVKDCHQYTEDGKHLFHLKASDEIREELHEKLNEL